MTATFYTLNRSCASLIAELAARTPPPPLTEAQRRERKKQLEAEARCARAARRELLYGVLPAGTLVKAAIARRRILILAVVNDPGPASDTERSIEIGRDGERYRVRRDRVSTDTSRGVPPPDATPTPGNVRAIADAGRTTGTTDEGCNQ
jgi:hypothetical protein